MNISQLRSKYKYEIEKIREHVHKKNLFISLSGIDEIIKLFEKLNLKERNEVQDSYLEKLLHYAIKLRENVDDRLINEILIKKADQEINKIEIDLITKIQSVEEIGLDKIERQSIVLELSQKVPETSTPEKKKTISQLRSKYQQEIEKIKEKVQSKNLFINLSGIDELISLFEPLNLKERSEILDTYLEKLLNYAIKFCENNNEQLINEKHIKQAILDVNKIEIDLMRKVTTTEQVAMVETARQPEEEGAKQEVADLSTPEEEPKEFEIIRENEVSSTLEEIPIEEETLHKEIVVSAPEIEPEEIIPPTPQIIDCPFCGLVKNETAIFCPQCGMIFKK